MIKVACNCGRQFQVADKYGGQNGKCPDCGSLIDIPKPSSANMLFVKCDCGNTYKVKQEWLGKSLKCPNCETTITVGGSAQAPAAAPAAATPAPPSAKPGPPAASESSLEPIAEDVVDDPFGQSDDPLGLAALGPADASSLQPVTPAGALQPATPAAPGMSAYGNVATPPTASRPSKTSGKLLLGIIIGSACVVIATTIAVMVTLGMFGKKEKKFDKNKIAKQMEEEMEKDMSRMESTIIQDLKRSSTWVLYKARDGSFQAKFPGEAFPERRKTPTGGTVSVITYDGLGLYCIASSVRTALPRSVTLKQVLEAEAQSIAAGLKAEIMDLKEFKFEDSYDGIEAKIASLDANLNMYGMVRAYHANGMSYFLICFGRKNTVEAASETFFESFKATDGPLVPENSL